MVQVIYNRTVGLGAMAKLDDEHKGVLFYKPASSIDQLAGEYEEGARLVMQVIREEKSVYPRL
jgi:hypothetical protein